jgi:nitric oxide reductase subunit C
VLIFDTEQRIPERSNAEAITPAVVRGKHLGDAQLHRLPHAAGRGRLLSRPSWATSTSAAVARFHQGLDEGAAHAHRRVAARCRSSISRAAARRLVEFLKWTNEINTEKWPPNIEG